MIEQLQKSGKELRRPERRSEGLLGRSRWAAPPSGSRSWASPPLGRVGVAGVQPRRAGEPRGTALASPQERRHRGLPRAAADGAGPHDGRGLRAQPRRGRPGQRPHLHRLGRPGLYALRAGDGSTIWRFETLGVVQSEPLYDPELDVVYFGSHDGALYAVQAQDGALVFRFMTGREVSRLPSSAASCSTSPNGADQLYALDRRTGKQRVGCTEDPCARDGGRRLRRPHARPRQGLHGLLGRAGRRLRRPGRHGALDAGRPLCRGRAVELRGRLASLPRRRHDAAPRRDDRRAGRSSSRATPGGSSRSTPRPARASGRTPRRSAPPSSRFGTSPRTCRTASAPTAAARWSPTGSSCCVERGERALGARPDHWPAGLAHQDPRGRDDRARPHRRRHAARHDRSTASSSCRPGTARSSTRSTSEAASLSSAARWSRNRRLPHVQRRGRFLAAAPYQVPARRPSDSGPSTKRH